MFLSDPGQDEQGSSCRQTPWVRISLTETIQQYFMLCNTPTQLARSQLHHEGIDECRLSSLTSVCDPRRKWGNRQGGGKRKTFKHGMELGRVTMMSVTSTRKTYCPDQEAGRSSGRDALVVVACRFDTGVPRGDSCPKQIRPRMVAFTNSTQPRCGIRYRRKETTTCRPSFGCSRTAAASITT